MHGQLFLIKHLILLRDSLTPYRIEFKITEQSISVPKVQDVVSLQWKQILPQIHSQFKDIRQELEMMLKQAISSLIQLYKEYILTRDLLESNKDQQQHMLTSATLQLHQIQYRLKQLDVLTSTYIQDASTKRLLYKPISLVCNKTLDQLSASSQQQEQILKD